MAKVKKKGYGYHMNKTPKSTMQEVHGTSRHCWYERICWKGLCIMTSIKVFGLQDSWMDSPPARYMNTTDSIHPYLTHMDQTAVIVEGRRSTDKQVKLYTN